ncbi:hypothetical protein [Intrasporangium flavum]|uniref:hypothetical protein n=1 Tax=Intrasporangium flavum TaxID=1428657 RepID=UPI00096F090D|nr:hypothetical protein [Intrasporangium flavum]
MSTVNGAMTLSPQEALARDLIVQRSAARHHAPRRVTRHVRAALLLRRLAERLDPPAATCAPEVHADRTAPRPWTAEPRRAPHRHS